MAGTMQPMAAVPEEHMEHVGRMDSVAGLVLGILSIVLGWVPVIGLACGIVGIVLSAKARRRTMTRSYKGMGTAGLVLSIIGTVSGGLATLSLAMGLLGYQAGWMNQIQLPKVRVTT